MISPRQLFVKLCHRDNLDGFVAAGASTHAAHLGALFFQTHTPLAPPINLGFAGLHLDHADGELLIGGVNATGMTFSFTMPAGFAVAPCQARMRAHNPSPRAMLATSAEARPRDLPNRTSVLETGWARRNASIPRSRSEAIDAAAAAEVGVMRAALAAAAA